MTMLHNLISTVDEEEKNRQGDIFKRVYFECAAKKLKAVLVTPACDLAHDKTDMLMFCAVLNFKKLFPVLLEKEFSGMSVEEFKEGNRATKIKKLLEKFLNNSFERYQWLGALPSQSGFWYIDFNITACCVQKTILPEQRICQVESPLKESIASRYASYMGRIGLPWEKVERLSLAGTIYDAFKDEL